MDPVQDIIIHQDQDMLPAQVIRQNNLSVTLADFEWEGFYQIPSFSLVIKND